MKTRISQIKIKKNTQKFIPTWGREKKTESKRNTINTNMMTVKWTLQWLFVSIILGLDYLQKINANEGAVSYIPALECYDPYGKPQVNASQFIFFLFARAHF